MPLYEYECEACGKRFEVIRKFSDPPLETCTLCGKEPVRRLQSSPAIQFKGTGWYITDYSQKGKSGGESADKRTADKGGEKADGKSSADSAPKTDATPSKAETSKAPSPAKSGGSDA